MATTTAKGYPYPVGTDRVMDGDDAIKALAEALDADATQVTRALTTGQGPLVVNTSTPILWDAPTQNGAALTKTSTSVFTVTRAGLYVIAACAITTGFTSSGARAYEALAAGMYVSRQVFAGENQATPVLVCPLVAGDTISLNILCQSATNIAAGTGFLIVARCGRA